MPYSPAYQWNNTVVVIGSCRRHEPKPEEKYETCGAIIRSAAILHLLVINGLAFYFYGLPFLSVDLNDDRFTAYMMFAFVELPAGNLYFQTFGPEYVKIIVVGVVCIIAGLLCLVLPETKDRPVPPDIRSLTATDDHTVDTRDREELMREQELDDDEGPSSENAPILRKEE
ncbi:hypothetical protein GCK32_002615 [Trichostrongylus colubriformis]|uniref:Uncharacterized protein n=1 Tax=Trichostrongylus colubriformis TaxID=6319 RepID=A0AAN8IJL3_TRICO